MRIISSIKRRLAQRFPEAAAAWSAQRESARVDIFLEVQGFHEVPYAHGRMYIKPFPSEPKPRLSRYPHCWWVHIGNRIYRVAKPWSHRQRDVWGPKLITRYRGIKGGL
jgi:hypothetical protein